MTVDSSPEQKTRVQLLMRQTTAGIDTTKADIDTCRDLFRAIRGEKEIRIPMDISEGILGLENRANEIILAMVCAVAVFNGHDTAAKEAADRALKIYRDIGAHSINKLIKAEKDLLKALLREGFFKNGRYMAKRARLPDGRHISGKRITDREPMKKGMMIPKALVRIMALLHLITWSKSIPRPEMKTKEISPR